MGDVKDFYFPMTGKLIELKEINDDVFAQGTLGQGFAIEFTGDKLVSPFDGTVIATFPTGHAFIVRRDDGLEALMHVGIQSAKNPEAFCALVKKYQKVEQGQVLTIVEKDKLKADSLICPVVFSDPKLKFKLLRLHEAIELGDKDAIEIKFDEA